MLSSNIKAILFDSGKVLNYPQTGNWFIPPDFFRYVSKEAFYKIPAYRKHRAFQRAYAYLDSQKLIATQEQELHLFQAYYRIFFCELPELGLSSGTVEKLAENLVYNSDKYQFYDDALEVLPELGVKYKLAIVSDAWPSLMDVYKKAGLQKYFSSIVISSILGTEKPDGIMYQTALDELGISAQDAVFVDDDVENCKGALRLGIHAVLLCRSKARYVFYRLTAPLREYPVINNLKQLTINKIIC